MSIFVSQCQKFKEEIDWCLWELLVDKRTLRKCLIFMFFKLLKFREMWRGLSVKFLLLGYSKSCVRLGKVSLKFLNEFAFAKIFGMYKFASIILVEKFRKGTLLLLCKFWVASGKPGCLSRFSRNSCLGERTLNLEQLEATQSVSRKTNNEGSSPTRRPASTGIFFAGIQIFWSSFAQS